MCLFFKHFVVLTGQVKEFRFFPSGKPAATASRSPAFCYIFSHMTLVEFYGTLPGQHISVPVGTLTSVGTGSHLLFH